MRVIYVWFNFQFLVRRHTQNKSLIPCRVRVQIYNFAKLLLKNKNAALMVIEGLKITPCGFHMTPCGFPVRQQAGKRSLVLLASTIPSPRLSFSFCELCGSSSGNGGSLPCPDCIAGKLPHLIQQRGKQPEMVTKKCKICAGTVCVEVSILFYSQNIHYLNCYYIVGNCSMHAVLLC